MMVAAEKAREAAGLSQDALARLLGMTQGHYSKLVAGKVPPGRRAADSVAVWLERQAAAPPDTDALRAEMVRLAADITMQCMRLTELAALR